MNKLLLPMLLTSPFSLYATTPFDHMHAMIDSMQQMSEQIDRSFQEMEESFNQMSHQMKHAPSGWKTSINETNDAVILSIKGISTNSIDAKLDEEKDLLRITTDEGTVVLYSAGKALQVTARQEQKSENDEESNKHHYISVNQSSMVRALGSEVDLEQAHIDFHKEGNELTITLDKKRELSKTKSLPVNIK